MDSGVLETIEADNPRDAMECCKQMLIKWLETNEQPSWKQLITVLKYSSIGLNNLSARIKKILKEEGETLYVKLASYMWLCSYQTWTFEST